MLNAPSLKSYAGQVNNFTVTVGFQYGDIKTPVNHIFGRTERVKIITVVFIKTVFNKKSAVFWWPNIDQDLELVNA